MIKSDDTSIAVLNTLIGVNNDAQAGYVTAATDVRDLELSRFFGETAAERMKFVDELSKRVRAMRGEPAKQGTLGGKVHRAIIDAKAANETAQAHAVLVECERAEDLAVHAYRKALETLDVDAQTHTLIQSQYERVDVNVELTTPSGENVSLGQVHGASACGDVAHGYAGDHHFEDSDDWGYVCCTIEHGDSCKHKIR